MEKRKFSHVLAPIRIKNGHEAEKGVSKKKKRDPLLPISIGKLCLQKREEKRVIAPVFLPIVFTEKKRRLQVPADSHRSSERG